MRAHVAMDIKAECEAIGQCNDDMQGGRQHGDATGDGEAIVEYQRFTREQFERGETKGWRFSSEWFERCSGLRWAWFQRDVLK